MMSALEGQVDQLQGLQKPDLPAFADMLFLEQLLGIPVWRQRKNKVGSFDTRVQFELLQVIVAPGIPAIWRRR